MKALEIITKDQCRQLRDAGFILIHREPIPAMRKAFYGGLRPEEVNFEKGFHRMVAGSIAYQNKELGDA